jgi:hypothetical protein
VVGPTIKQFNLEIVVSVLLDGSTYKVHHQWHHELGLRALGKNSYCHAERKVAEIMVSVKDAHLHSIMDKYHSGELQLVNLGGDGAWLNQHNSSVGYYNLTDVDTGKIICESVLAKKVV